MAAKLKTGDRVTLQSGPWRGVRTTPNPFDDQKPDELAAAVNLYPTDAVRGGGFFLRPGATRPASVSGALATRGGVMVVALDGTVYNFVFIENGSSVVKLYRWDSMGASLTDVTPTNVVIASSKPLYALPVYNGETGLVEMVVNDGVNKPWRASSLGSTPVVATVIEYQTPETILSIGSNDVRLANTAFTGTWSGTQATFAANAVGTAIGALGQIAANTWGIILVEASNSTTLVFTAAFNAGAGYASETLAIAALPARTAGRRYVGYVTVRADAGAVWIAGTDAFQGGSTGNQAQTTNYYAGEGAAWSAFGQPWVYYGSVFFIANQLATVYARTAFLWGEPGLPAIGYQQTDYDNLWDYIQTGSAPLYAGVGTNDAMYLFRELSIGAVAGAPGVNFQGSATHDVVAGNVGCPHPKSVVLWRDTIYFADQTGKPYRFRVGGYPEPIWTQAQSIFDATTVTNDATLAPWAVVEPNLNLYLLNYRDSSDTNYLLVFDAITGLYAGLWLIGNEIMAFGAQYRDGATTATGNVSVGFFQLPAASVFAWKLGIPSDNVWADNTSTAIAHSLTTGRMAYDDLTAFTVDTARTIVGYNSTAAPTVQGTLSTSQRASVNLGNGQAVASPPNQPLHRLWWSAPAGTTGRGVMLTLSVADVVTRQTRFYRIRADAIASETTPEDW